MRDNGIVSELGVCPVTPDANAGGRRVDLLVPPECLAVCENGSGVRARVVQVVFQGTRKIFTVRLPSGHQLQGLCAHDTPLQVGLQIHVRHDPAVVITFPSLT